MTVEHGIRVVYADGRTEDRGPSSLAYCRLTVAAQTSTKASWEPRAVAVLRREVTGWELLGEGET